MVIRRHRRCRKSRAALLLAALALLTCVLAACSKPVPAYPGPRRGADEVAILRANGLSRVLTLDGTDRPGRAFELLPGKHTLHVKFEGRLSEIDPAYEQTGQTLRAYCDVRFFAKAGHLYRFGMSFDPDVGWGKIPSKPTKHFNWYPYLVDVSDERVLEDAVDRRNCHLPRDKNA
jgi:hypothetical protein